MERSSSRFTGCPEHLRLLRQAADTGDTSLWNGWRRESGVERPDLSGATLDGVVLHDVDLQFVDLAGASLRDAKVTAALDHANLDGADLTNAHLWACRFDETRLRDVEARGCQFTGSRIVASNFSHARLQGADFERCYLEDTIFDEADLSGASFYEANLWMAFLEGATMVGTRLRGANLHGAHLQRATLAGCDLTRAVFVDSNISGATIVDCNVYGASAWGLIRDAETRQRNLRLSNADDAPLFVDDIEVAQFVYLMVRNPRIRDVIDTISRKGVLILGRFTPARKAVLDAIRERLREGGYVPMLFDFEKPSQRDFDETVKVLAGLSRFVIADMTNPSSSPLELQATIPDYMIPFVPIIERGEAPFSMLAGLQHKYWWVLNVVEYPSAAALLRELDREVIGPALEMERRILEHRARPPEVRRIAD